MAIPINPLELPDLPDDDVWNKRQNFTGNVTFTNYNFPIIRAAYPNIMINDLVTVNTTTTGNTTNINFIVNTNNTAPGGDAILRAS